MEIVLGVSMTSSAVRMVLVEGAAADGITVDHDTFKKAAAGTGQQVVSAILGTRESAAEGGHRLVSTGVAWTDHAEAARLRDALRAHRIDDVVLVSELHAASALAQAIGRTIGCARTALVFVEDDTATLAVVRTSDGAVVKVQTRDSAAVPAMIAELEALTAPPQAVFVMGSSLGDADTEVIRSQIAARTTLPVHAPHDAELALARGAALASAHTPRFEAETVGLMPSASDDTAAGLTQTAPAGYMAPLGYSAVADDESCADLLVPDEDELPIAEPDRKPFLLAGSALAAVFVIGVAALVISLAVSIKPAVDQRPDPGPVAGQTAAPAAPPPAAPPETIQAPVPVVQVAPRTVYVTPAPQAPVVVTQAPAAAPPVPAPAAVPVEPAPAAPAPAAPVPPPAPPIAQIVPPWLRGPGLPAIFLPPGTNPLPAQSYPSLPSLQLPAQSDYGSSSGAVISPPQARGERRNPLWQEWSPFG